MRHDDNGDSEAPLPLFPSDWTRTAFVFILLIDTVALLLGVWMPSSHYVNRFSTFLGLVSLALGVGVFFFTAAPWFTRPRYAFTAFAICILFTGPVAVMVFFFQSPAR